MAEDSRDIQQQGQREFRTSDSRGLFVAHAFAAKLRKYRYRLSFVFREKLLLRKNFRFSLIDESAEEYRKTSRPERSLPPASLQGTLLKTTFRR